MRQYLILLLLLSISGYAFAQDEVDFDAIETSVYATTQFDLNFREGPGLNWDVIEIIPAAETVPVIGRTASTGWIQIVFNGQSGWVSRRYVVWTGDIIQLPVDGQYFEDYVRRVWINAPTIRETPYYIDWVDPSTQVGTFPEDTELEVVGRLGTGRYFNVMVLYEGQFYWVGSWNLDTSDFPGNPVLNNSYRNAYTRLTTAFNSDLNTAFSRMSSIESIWVRLQIGEAVGCGTIPHQVSERTVSASDLSNYPEFLPVGIAYDNGIGQVNTAISMFEDACNRTDSFLTQEDVRVALDEVDSARRNFNVASSLLTTLRFLDPLVGGF